MPRPFHICFTFIGDIHFDSRLLKCARTLSSSGFQVSAITADNGGERAELLGTRVIRIRVSHHSRGIFRFLTFYLNGFLPSIRTRADCYFASDLYSLPLAFVAAKMRRAKLLYDSRELYSAIAALQRRKFVQHFWSYVEKRIIHSVDAVFTVNDSLASIISERYRISKPITLLNCPPKQQILKSNSLREILPISPEQKIVLYQGGLQNGRGIFLSLSLIKRISTAVLVFLGQGNLRNEITKFIEEAKLQRRVFLLDAVPAGELLQYTASADIGLCLIENFGASYYHSLPNKLFEYVAAGVPVVASNFPEIKHFVESNKVGLVVNPNNEEEIVAAIQRLLSDSALYSSLVSNCRDAARRYTWENEEKKLLAAVEDLRKA